MEYKCVIVFVAFICISSIQPTKSEDPAPILKSVQAPNLNERVSGVSSSELAKRSSSPELAKSEHSASILKSVDAPILNKQFLGSSSLEPAKRSEESNKVITQTVSPHHTQPQLIQPTPTQTQPQLIKPTPPQPQPLQYPQPQSPQPQSLQDPQFQPLQHPHTVPPQPQHQQIQPPNYQQLQPPQKSVDAPILNELVSRFSQPTLPQPQPGQHPQPKSPQPLQHPQLQPLQNQHTLHPQPQPQQKQPTKRKQRKPPKKSVETTIIRLVSRFSSSEENPKSINGQKPSNNGAATNEENENTDATENLRPYYPDIGYHLEQTRQLQHKMHHQLHITNDIHRMTNNFGAETNAHYIRNSFKKEFAKDAEPQPPQTAENAKGTNGQNPSQNEAATSEETENTGATENMRPYPPDVGYHLEQTRQLQHKMNHQLHIVNGIHRMTNNFGAETNAHYIRNLFNKEFAKDAQSQPPQTAENAKGTNGQNPSQNEAATNEENENTDATENVRPYNPDVGYHDKRRRMQQHIMNHQYQITNGKRRMTNNFGAETNERNYITNSFRPQSVMAAQENPTGRDKAYKKYPGADQKSELPSAGYRY